MRLAWWGVVTISVALVAGGLYIMVASQDAIAYIKSCGKAVAVCAGAGPGTPVPKLGLTVSLVHSFQEAQLVWLLGLAMLGVGLAGIAYGIYLHPSIRKPGTSSDVEIGQENSIPGAVTEAGVKCANCGELVPRAKRCAVCGVPLTEQPQSVAQSER